MEEKEYKIVETEIREELREIERESEKLEELERYVESL